MKNIKKCFSKIFLLCLSILLNFCFISIKAQTTDILNEIETDLQINIDTSSKIDLYGSDDNIIAEFYKLDGIGYIIISTENDDVIEYSTENNNLFITDQVNRYYYGGPLNYYELNSHENKLIKLDSDEVVQKDVAVINRNKENLKLTNARSIPMFGNLNYKIPYTPRTYKYNPNGICGSTASAILLMYYRDHKSLAYVSSNLVSSDGKKLINNLRPLIDGVTPGSTYADLINGLKKYLSKKSVIYNVKKYSLVAGANRIHDTHYPVLAGVTKHPTYKEHWVVAYGFYAKSGLISYLVVNNGWGQNGVNIGAKYIDGVVGI